MVTRILILTAYFFIILCVGIFSRTRWRSSPEDYFLANRKFGPLVLVGTIMATNFSAFTVFGTSGAGYRDGYAFFPIIGFGTGFMSLTFWILGRKIRQISHAHAIITPPEFVRELYGSKFLSFLFALVMIVFTIPYLALQPMAAGYIIEALTGLPYFFGCILVTCIVIFYTLFGGMRAVAWTDLCQGIMMFLLLVACFVVVTSTHGGITWANHNVVASFPELFSRPGGESAYTPGIWFSYLMLWFFCDPMFPQIFQRFFTARNDRALALTMFCYPLVCSLVFFMPIALGVMGHLSFTSVTARESDKILMMIVSAMSSDLLAAFVMTAGLAALMSTMDSQLLTTSSIFARDLAPLLQRKKNKNNTKGHTFVMLLGLAGLLLAYSPPATILKIATFAFTGLAVLFPTVFFGLYLKKKYPLPAILSILSGESLVLLFCGKIISAGPFLPVVWSMLGSFSVYLGVHSVLMLREGAFHIFLPKCLRDPFTYLFAGIFICALDFWAWGSIGTCLLGIPLWVFYFLMLSVIQTILMIIWVGKKNKLDNRK